MKEHFRKKIYPNLQTFRLTEKDYDAIRFGYLKTAMKKRKVKVKVEEVLFRVDDDED